MRKPWDIKKESVLYSSTSRAAFSWDVPQGHPRTAGCTRKQNNRKKETAGMDTFEKIRALLAEQLDIDPSKITMESDIMSDFEADSLDIVDMVMTLED